MTFVTLACRQNDYLKQLSSSIEEYQTRYKTLRSGVKAMFGLLDCSGACIVLDVSDSMASKMRDMRDKVHQLLDEQVCVWKRHVFSLFSIDSCFP